MRLKQLDGSSLSDQAAGQIREAIQTGRYRPGTRLVERRLAAELGTSHIPIREALARLSDEGLVERFPRRGARVAGLSLTELEELSSLRSVLEQFAVVRVQERLTVKTEAELRRIVDNMMRAAQRKEVERVFQLDRQFHARLWALSDHSVLADVVAHLRGRLDSLLREATIKRPAREMRIHAQAHADLLDAILSRDSGRAQRKMAEHVKDAAERLRAVHSTT